MSVYRISQEKAQVESSRAITRSVVLIIIAVVLGAAIGGHSIIFEGKADKLWFGTMGLMLILAVIYTVKSLKRRLAEAYSSFELSIDDKCVTKSQKNTPTVTLLRSQITRVEEFQGKGFRISTEDRNSNIWVPLELEGYDELKTELRSPSIEYRSQERSWLRSNVQLGFMLVLFAIQGLVPNKYVAASAAFLISGWLCTYFYRHFWNPNLSKKGKQQILLSLFLALVLAARAVLLLRG